MEARLMEARLMEARLMEGREMGLYASHVEPRLISLACSVPVITDHRTGLVPQASGVVLELGFGSGLNLPHYDAGKVDKVYALEPHAPIRSLAAKRLRESALNTELLQAGAEAVPLPDGSVDTVLVTFTLCTVPDLAAALSEARRVLRAEGRVLFAEHGLAPDMKVALWQRRVEPLWGRLAGGCHLTRDVPAALVASGFALPRLAQGYAPGGPRIASYISAGTARPA